MTFPCIPAHPMRRNKKNVIGLMLSLTVSSLFRLTRIRRQFVVYFCLLRGSLPGNTAGRQRDSGTKAAPNNFRQKLYVRSNPDETQINDHVVCDDNESHVDT